MDPSSKRIEETSDESCRWGQGEEKKGKKKGKGKEGDIKKEKDRKKKEEIRLVPRPIMTPERDYKSHNATSL